MRAPDDDSSQTTVLSFERGQIANATFVQTAAVIDYQNLTGLRTLHCFQENINASKMSDRQGRAGETLIGCDRSNARRRDSEWKLQTQRGIGDERSRKFGKSARQRFRFHSATLLAFSQLCKGEESF
jgi:hypothetical protein